MAQFEVSVDSPLSAPEAWRRVLDLRAHDAVIPLTHVTGDDVDPERLHEGSRFLARTGVGPLGFDDPMVVESWTSPTDAEPGVAVIRKEGRLVTGSITLTVTPTGTGSRVHWRQRMAVRGVPGPLEPAVVRAASVGYERVLRQLLRRG